MAVYPSVYRARITQIRGRRVQALVPQVFGEAPIVIEQFIGVVPTRPRMAWVFFQGGNPEFPVLATGGSYNISITEGGGGGGGEDIDVIRQRNYQWTANSTDETDPGRGKAKSNHTNPLLATEVYVSLYDQSGQAAVTALDLKAGDQIAMYQAGDLSKGVRYTLMSDIVNHDFEWLSAEVTVEEDLGFAPKNNESVVIASYATIPGGGGGGGGGTDEVWIGPSDPIPTNPLAELWYDTDDTGDSSINYWNTSWGIVGKGAFVTNPITIAANPTKTQVASMTCNTVAGRRYLVRLYCNAMTAGISPMELHVDGVQKTDGPWTSVASSYSSVTGYWSMLENLTTGQHMFSVVFANQGAAFTLYNDGGHFILEDMGPVVRAAVPPPTAQTPVVASGNAIGIVSMGVYAQANDFDSAANTLTTIASVTATLQVGRRYRLFFACRATLTSASTGTGTISLYSGGAQFGGGYWKQFRVSGYDNIQLEWIFEGDGAPRTIEVRASIDQIIRWHVGYGTSFIYVEDVGPNAAPALPLVEPPPSWIPPVFENGWSDYGYPGWERAGYRKIGDIVYLRGLVKRAAGDLSQQAIFFLPAGFRPPAPLIFNVNSATTSYQNARLDVQVTGAVYVNDTRPGYSAFTSLSGVSFSVT